MDTYSGTNIVSDTFWRPEGALRPFLPPSTGSRDEVLARDVPEDEERAAHHRAAEPLGHARALRVDHGRAPRGPEEQRPRGARWTLPGRRKKVRTPGSTQGTFSTALAIHDELSMSSRNPHRISARAKKQNVTLRQAAQQGMKIGTLPR